MAEEKKRDNDYTIDMGRERSPTPVPRTPPPSHHSIPNNPILAVISYCGSSILMTVTNKYVLSGMDYNLNFLLLCVQVRIGQAAILRSQTY
jgi:GDP-mannose transporter